MVMFAIVGVLFVASLLNYFYNVAQPTVRRSARVISKRSETSGSDSSVSTNYFVTFESDGGERAEHRITGNEYGLISEGDSGELETRGSLYWGFRRFGRR